MSNSVSHERIQGEAPEGMYFLPGAIGTDLQTLCLDSIANIKDDVWRRQTCEGFDGYDYVTYENRNTAPSYIASVHQACDRIVSENNLSSVGPMTGSVVNRYDLGKGIHKHTDRQNATAVISLQSIAVMRVEKCSILLEPRDFILMQTWMEHEIFDGTEFTFKGKAYEQNERRISIASRHYE